MISGRQRKRRREGDVRKTKIGTGPRWCQGDKEREGGKVVSGHIGYQYLVQMKPEW